MGIFRRSSRPDVRDSAFAASMVPARGSLPPAPPGKGHCWHLQGGGEVYRNCCWCPLVQIKRKQLAQVAGHGPRHAVQTEKPEWVNGAGKIDPVICPDRPTASDDVA